MRPPSHSRQGFTGIEILLVLAVVGVLGGIGYAATARSRTHAAEAEMRQDLIHFVNQQQALRQRTGSLGTLQQVRDGGYRLSPGVAVEASRADARRAYLRVAHRATGRRCSVDYSPYASNALNRIQCWGGPDDPGGIERAAPVEVATVPRVTVTEVDTATSRPCAPGSAACVCAALAAPSLAAPADRTGRPGATGTGVFTLRNPGPGERTFSLLFSSSDPGVVASVAGPGSVTLPAGASLPLAAAYEIGAGAWAGQTAALPLRATDTGCPALAADAHFSVSAELVLGELRLTAPPGLTVEAGTGVEGSWLSSTATNSVRSMELLAEEEPGLVRESADGLGPHPYPPGQTRTTPLRYRLDPERVDGFETRAGCIRFRDVLAPAHQRRECFALTAAFTPRTPRVAVAAAREAGQDETFTAEWTVVNTSNAERRFRIAPATAGDLVLVRALGTGDSVRIARGAVHRVQAEYRVKRPSAARTLSRGSLRVTDADARYAARSDTTAAFDVATRLEVCAPELLTAPPARSEKPGAAFAATWRVRNCTNDRRELRFTPGPDADALALDPVARPFDPFEAREVTVHYRMKDRSVHLTRSDPTLQAADADRGATYTFPVTTALDLREPSLAGPAARPAQPQDPGTGATLAYTIHNHSNAPRPFTFHASTTDPAAAAVLAVTPDGPVPAYGEAPVAVTYAVPVRALGGATAGVTLTGRDAEAGSATATFAVEARVVAVAPRVAFAGDRTVQPGATESSAATLHNGSNVEVNVCLSPEAASGTVAAGQAVSAVHLSAPAGCTRIAPFGEVPATLTYTLADPAEAGWTNQIILRAWDGERPTLSSDGRFTVTTGLRVRAPGAEWRSGLDVWEAGASWPQVFSIQNHTNTTRFICFSYGSDEEGVVIPTGGAGEADCTRELKAGESLDLPERMFTGIKDSGDNPQNIWIKAWDRDTPGAEAYGRKAVMIKPRIAPVPTACFAANGRYVYQWVEFDASCSRRNDGAEVVAWEWDWGLPGSRWDDVQGRFVSGPGGPETLTTPAVRRAWDDAASYPVCLVVVNAAGARSERVCQDLSLGVETRARLGWRFRSWWSNSGQGVMRHEFDFSASAGSKAIRSAWVDLSVRFNYKSGGRVGEEEFGPDAPRPEELSQPAIEATCGTTSIVSMGNGEWCYENAWRMRWNFAVPIAGEIAPYTHPMYNAEALGQLVRGTKQPDKLPTHSWFTLHVVDEDGRETTERLSRYHEDGDGDEWHYNYEPAAGFKRDDFHNVNATVAGLPVAALLNADNASGTPTFKPEGTSRDGRIVRSWLVAVHNPGDKDPPQTLYEGPGPYTPEVPACGVITVTAHAADNWGRSGSSAPRRIRAEKPCSVSGGQP